jgi:hypothetical protein
LGVVSKKAVNELTIMRKLGVSKISVSYDEFHAQFVAPEKVQNVLNASKSSGVPIILGIAKSSSRGIGRIIDSLGESIVNATKVNVYPALPAGGKKILVKAVLFCSMILTRM